MLTVAESLTDDPKIQVVQRMYDALNAKDIDGVMATMTTDIQEYMLEPKDTPLFGAEHVSRYWRKVVNKFDAEWRIERGFSCADEAVVEWSMKWTHPEDGQPYIVHGSEFYTFRGDLVSEIRGYYHHGEARDTGLTGFPYKERGFTVIERAEATA